MKRMLRCVPAVVLAGIVAGCAGGARDAGPSACAAIAAITASPAAARLAGRDPHSAAGVLWADARAACPGGKPKPGVDPSWAAQVLQLLAAAAPYVAPILASTN